MIAVEALSKRFGQRPALEDLAFAVPEGEIFGFLGPNGAGKTTTIRILATLMRPDSGRVTVGGRPVDRDPFGVRRMVGYMPDFFGVYDRLTTIEYLEFYAACHDVPARQRGRVAAELLELVDLSERAGDQVDTLSRGMKQRLCLARALVHGPQVLLLDEPASGLDPRARVEMRDLIRELRQMGKTILVSSHIVPEVEELCTWIGVIDRGRMVEVGPKADVLGRFRAGRRVRIELVGISPRQLAAAQARVARRTGVREVTPVEGGLEVTVGDGFTDHLLLRSLVQAGFDVASFTPMAGSLSDVFLSLTGPGEDDANGSNHP